MMLKEYRHGLQTRASLCGYLRLELAWGITNNLAEIKEDFEVYGLSEKGTWEEFEVGEDYEAFLITKK